MSYRWNRTASFDLSRYSSKYRHQNGVIRYFPPNSSNYLHNISRETLTPSRFHFRKGIEDVPKAFTDFRKIVWESIKKKRNSELKSGVAHFNASKNAIEKSFNRPSYKFPSPTSKFKYRRKSMFVKKAKSRASPKEAKSINSFSHQTSAPRCTFTPIHPYKSCVKRAININRRFVRKICPDYVKTGFCESGEVCQLRHDPKYLRICSKFLQNACLLGENKCPLAHIMDPCRIPQCAFFAKGTCSRCCCNFLHVKYLEKTPSCPDFLVGRCEKGPTCKKRHIWRGELDSFKTETSASTSIAAANEDLAKKSAQLGSLRETKVIPDYIPFYVSDN